MPNDNRETWSFIHNKEGMIIFKWNGIYSNILNYILNRDHRAKYNILSKYQKL